MPADLYLTPDDRLLFVGLTGDEYVEVYDVSQPAPKLVKRIQTTGRARMPFRVARRRAPRVREQSRRPTPSA